MSRTKNELAVSLPSFLIVGAAKSGTTSLIEHLRKHKSIFVPRISEVHYFDKDTHHNKKYYSSYFSGRDRRQICGEKTPRYMYVPKCMPRIRKMLPNVKIVVILRNPIDRAYSHYHMSCRNGYDRNEFGESIRSEIVLDDTNEAKINDYEPKEFYYHYIDRGLYSRQLKRIYKHYNKSQVHVIIFERLLANRRQEMDRLCNFIGVKPFDTMENVHIRQTAKNCPPMKSEDRSFLKDRFETDVKELKGIIKDKIPEWKDFV